MLNQKWDLKFKILIGKINIILFSQNLKCRIYNYSVDSIYAKIIVFYLMR